MRERLKGEIVRSSEIIENTLLITTGDSGFHMRPIAALNNLLIDFERVYNVKVAVCVGDNVYIAPNLPIVGLTLAGLTKGKQFTLKGYELPLTEDQLLALKERVELIDHIGESVGNAVDKVLSM